MAHPTVVNVEAVRRCARHLGLWLAATGLTYNRTAREDFARSHPELFGQAYDVTLRGYDRWRGQRCLADNMQAFALYLTWRHERWLAQVPASGAAPCLFRAESWRQSLTRRELP